MLEGLVELVTTYPELARDCFKPEESDLDYFLRRRRETKAA